MSDWERSYNLVVLRNQLQLVGRVQVSSRELARNQFVALPNKFNSCSPKKSICGSPKNKSKAVVLYNQWVVTVQERNLTLVVLRNHKTWTKCYQKMVPHWIAMNRICKYWSRWYTASADYPTNIPKNAVLCLHKKLELTVGVPWKNLKSCWVVLTKTN